MLCADTHAIAKILKINVKKLANIKFNGVFTDTRNPVKNGLFVALVGANFDAHNYLDEAQRVGAVAVIVSRKVDTKLATIMVDDTQVALSIIANWHSNNTGVKIIAITGSNGKTTTKNMLANILKLADPTLATIGNLNNHLGVPMTLLNLTNKHKYAVIEMGANHIGEIKHLCKIAPPDISIITNACDAHIGEFGSLTNLVAAKSEIYASLNEDGTAIINNNSELKRQWTDLIGAKKIVYFGSNSDIFATEVVQKDNKISFVLHVYSKQQLITLKLIGAHNIDNALAACACAYALGIDIKTIKQGLQNTVAATGRLSVVNNNNVTIIDDSYNANPHSMRAAINALLKFPGEKVIILGAMAELGDETKQFHRQIGEIALESADFVYSYGDLAQSYAVEHFVDLNKLACHIINNHYNATILIKGSRLAQLDKLVVLLTAPRNLKKEKQN